MHFQAKIDSLEVQGFALENRKQFQSVNTLT